MKKKTEFHVFIKHYYLMGKDPVQARQWLEKCYSDSATSKTTICWWYANFKCTCIDTNDAECSGRPNKAVTLENIEQVLKIVMDSNKLKICEIAEMVNTSKGVHLWFYTKNWAQRKFFQMSVTFTHNGTKATKNRWFISLFGTVFWQ